MILRNFANGDGGLHFWRRGFTVGDVKVTTPENLFLEEDLYTVIGDEGERDVALEQAFSKLESAGAHFLGQLLSIVRAGKTPRMGKRLGISSTTSATIRTRDPQRGTHAS
jgi:hypothetical protein